MVKQVEDNGDVAVQYDEKKWKFNASALRKVSAWMDGGR